MPASESPWLDGLTIPQMLARTVQEHGRWDALVFPQAGRRSSYESFHEEVGEAARALLAMGVGRGEHVGLWATNLPEWVVLQFATAQIGAVLVNINPAYRARELKYVLNQADITTLFLTDAFKNSDYFEILAGLCPEMAGCEPGRLELAAVPRLSRVVSIKESARPGMYNWSTFRSLAETVAPAALAQVDSELKAEDVVNIQYTSGTTGFPKGAMLTHRNLLLNAYYCGCRLNFSHRDRLCIPVPFYHCFGCVLGTLLCAVFGAAMVVPSESFDPLAVLRAVQDERCTGIYGVPTMFIGELNHPRFAEFNLSSLRTGIMAGSPCPIEVMRAVVDRMGARDMTIAYGLTEASPVITQSDARATLEHRVSTVGQPLPGLEVRIAEPETMQPLPPNQPGELLVRGHAVMKGYYRKPEETARAITADGWLHTGDLAVQTDDSYYRITGRLKDMIIRGGENVYPREIEEVLYRHPAVADVQVVGLPDVKFGEEISAWIQLRKGHRADVDEIRDHCRQELAHYKVPRYVIFVDEYPTTVTGKVQKYRLREIGIERFNLHKAAAIETA